MASRKNLTKKIARLNEESVRPLKIRFCPRCRATNVGFVFRLQNIFGLLPRVECYDCGHFGNEFPLLVIDKQALMKKNKKVMKHKKRVTKSKERRRGT